MLFPLTRTQENPSNTSNLSLDPSRKKPHPSAQKTTSRKSAASENLLLQPPPLVTPTIVKTEVIEHELREIIWRRFNFPWCIGYSPKIYCIVLDLIIHKDSNDFRPHHLRPILFFNIEANLHNNHIGKLKINTAENIYALARNSTEVERPRPLTYRPLTHAHSMILRGLNGFWPPARSTTQSTTTIDQSTASPL